MMSKVTEIITKYGAGEYTMEQANVELAKIGSMVYLGERKGNAMLDTGTGSLDPVIVIDGKLTNASAMPHDIVIYEGEHYHLAEDGVTLVEIVKE